MADPDSPQEWTEERRRAFRPALRARRERLVRQVIGLALVALAAGGVLLRLPETWWVPAVGRSPWRPRLPDGARVPRSARRAASGCPRAGGRWCRGCGLPLDE